MAGTHGRLPGSTRRKVGTTSNHHAPYVLGFTHATMAGTMGCETVRWSESLKVGLSSDWGLQLDPMKSESLVIADQQCCGEYVPGDRKSTRLNSSHVAISYAVFCLKKKKKNTRDSERREPRAENPKHESVR